MQENSSMKMLLFEMRELSSKCIVRKNLVFTRHLSTIIFLFRIGVWISLKGIPILIGTFSAFYWGYGLSNYFDSDVQMKAGI